MGMKFLSDEWFAKIEELKNEAGDLNTPDGLADLVLNVTVQTDDGDVEMCLNGGNFQKGHEPNAPTQLTMPFDIARKLFIENDQSAGMQGFMSGQIKVEGDMSKLMAMQTVQPSSEQKALQQKILELTEG